MTWLALFFALELGFLPNGAISLYELYEHVPLIGAGYTTLEAEAQIFRHVFIGGEVKTYVYKYAAGNLSFTPISAEYAFRAGVRLDPVEIGFRHYCTHPVYPWVYQRGFSPPQWEGWYQEIYLRVEATF